MKATVIRVKKIVPPGAVYPKLLQPGETLDGAFAERAVREGWARKAPGTATEKALGGAPESKFQDPQTVAGGDRGARRKRTKSSG